MTPPPRTISAARAIRRGAGCAGSISKYCAMGMQRGECGSQNSTAGFCVPRSAFPSPVVPHRLQIAGQRRQVAEIDRALVRAMEVRAARREEPELPGEVCKLGVLRPRMAAGDDLDA